ncbi:MAG TPA: ABC transporter ATP-binding protein [Tepidisphaeraceae bacterium]|nr:ABC transporter ATP-binding protein [Tepidisphaeraceae bacterium]
MSTPIITAEGLGKAYRLGLKVDKHQTFRDAIMGAFTSPLQKLKARIGEPTGGEDTFWAIRDISFDVNRGEVIGLIGRNGAGKSTLLKVLSRITEPTEGKATLRGRVASLLEVGTGFHPELTGRENIYLNGAILGMKKAEIDSKFDQIVEFAEVSKFLDTQVKRYSSGMYVRLAFAVAAHLEPEILIVDEVLAVGDASFQKKCLGKMSDVVKDGRTILFVSHNMDAIASLCTHTLLVQGGRVGERLTSDEGIKRYMALSNEGSHLPLRDKPRIQSKKRPPVFVGISIQGSSGHKNVVESGGGVTFEVEIANCEDLKSGGMCGIAITNDRGQRIAFFHTLYQAGFTFSGSSHAKLTCHVPNLPLVPNSYFIELVLADGYGIIEKVERADRLDVVYADVLGTGKIPGSRQGYVVWPSEWDYTGEMQQASEMATV